MATGSLGQLTIDLAANITRFERSLTRAEQLASKKSANIKRTFVRLATGVATAFASFQLVRQIEQSINFADTIGKTADKLGIATDALQEYRFAAEQSGVAQSALDIGLQRFTRRLGEAAQGEGVLKDVLKDLNIEIRNADGSLRTTEAVLGDYADAIKNADSSQRQLLLAFKAFDTEGAALVNLLKGGSEAIEGYAAEAQKLGIVIGEDVIRSSEKAVDSLNRVNKILSIGLTKTLAGLAPTIDTVADAFAQFVSGDIKELPGWIASVAKGFANTSTAVEKTTTIFGALGAAMALVVTGEAGKIPLLLLETQNQLRASNTELEIFIANIDRAAKVSETVEGVTGTGIDGGGGVSDITKKLSQERIDEISGELEFTEDILAQAETAHKKHLQERTKIEREFAASKRSIEQGILTSTLSLLSTLGRESKGFAIAALVVEKGIAIAQATINTAVAVTKALAIDPTGSLAARVKTLGAIQIGLIAATGVAQASQLGGGGTGGAALGTPSNPIATTDTALPFESGTTASGGTITINVTGVITPEILEDLMIPAIQDAVENKDVILIRGDSRNALELI